MSSNQAGFEYEQVVLSAIKKAGISGDIMEAAGASNAIGDADFRIAKKAHLVEVKLDKNAQMGGTSVSYLYNCTEMQLLNAVEPEVTEMIFEAVEEQQKELDALLRFFAQEWDPTIFSFPVRVPKTIWTQAQNDGLLVNSQIQTDVNKFLAKFYRSKGVNYIQIGKCGLFHLGRNPAKLPVPKLKGTVNLEIRTARSGSKMNKSLGCKVATGAIRVQARLKTKNVSPYTLDDLNSIKAMLKAR
jgi:hypothetical protein